MKYRYHYRGVERRQQEGHRVVGEFRQAWVKVKQVPDILSWKQNWKDTIENFKFTKTKTESPSPKKDLL